MKLHVVRLGVGANLPTLLEISDGIDEQGMHPWLADAESLLQGNDVGCGLFYDAKAIALQLTDYGCLPGAGRPG